MRIAAISVAPIFPDTVIGGSQKILEDVSVGLKRAGHDIQIWCTGTAGNQDGFEIDGVPVRPDLNLRGVFPATHQVSPAALARTAATLRDAAEWADRVYLHADAVYLRHALEGAEIVRSLHDFTYEEALLSALILPAATTVVPSEYLKRCIETAVALSGNKSIEPVVVVPNGVRVPDVAPLAALPDGIAPRVDGDLILLFPHRPEPTKGVREAMQVAAAVQKQERSRNVRLLMPAYPSDAAFDDAAGSTDEILRVAEEVGAVDVLELHRWLSSSEMAGYYAAGDATLCVGSFIESFGLVPVESVVSGTPAVCARVGALREFEGIDGISLVPYGDVDLAVEAVAISAGFEAEVCDSGRAQIASRYSFDAMISGYERAIAGELGERRFVQVDGEIERLELAPWCDVHGDRIYDDYAALTGAYPELTADLGSSDGRSLVHDEGSGGDLAREIADARTAGVLVPRFRFD